MAGSKLSSFSAEKDLIKEVPANNPFENSNRKPVAENFKQALLSLNISFQGQPTERCVSDRMSILIQERGIIQFKGVRAGVCRPCNTIELTGTSCNFRLCRRVEKVCVDRQLLRYS